ncbi:hypothetical protein [Aneurinibacillus tyrosinisolvens]|uniref:hypothetical protein n=1 Tax=Aneurinibacillus tyrosinisolvens TaxID=1443435 RepID=UPI00063FBC32|nr:hypothetical protein [Aneurinibacillus tyrosinisolvens]
MADVLVNSGILGGAILSIILGVYLWRKGDPKESFWEALMDVIIDFFTLQLPAFFTFRAWAVFLCLIGFGVLIIAIVAW